jgi:hypothetical protein
VNAKLLGFILVSCLVAGAAAAQDRMQPTQPGKDGAGAQSTQPGKDGAGGREPPAQAFEDCKGKKAGDTVQHTTPEGKVSATCAESPKGLVARPAKPKGAQQDGKAPQQDAKTPQR